MKELENRLMLALIAVLDAIELPEKNCSCHISPPCDDCVRHGALREACEKAEAVLKEVKL